MQRHALFLVQRSGYNLSIIYLPRLAAKRVFSGEAIRKQTCKPRKFPLRFIFTQLLYGQYKYYVITRPMEWLFYVIQHRKKRE